MVIKYLCFFLCVGFLQTGCEVPLTRKNIRSPHLPVFAEITPQTKSPSNPYWIRFAGVDDDVSITLSDGYVFKPDRPTLIGTLGTHYRFNNDYYIYAMTDGIGTQYDAWFNDDSKAGMGAFIGVNSSWGVQVFAAKKMGQLFGVDITLYSSLQRRDGYQHIVCENLQGALCREGAPTSNNNMRSQHKAIDYILGAEIGRIKIGDLGNTTLNFKFEVGYNQILNQELEFENFPSNFTQNKNNLFFSLHSGFTLW